MGERVGDIPVDRLGAPGGISVVPVRLGVLWGEVWLLGLSFGTCLSHSTVEMLSRSLGFVWLVCGSRFVDRGRDDGGVPGRMGEGHCFSLWVSDIDPSVTGETP